MDTKWKKSKAVLGFLAFVLGVSLLLEGGLFFWSSLSSSYSRQWVQDSFQDDWRNTVQFKDFICSRLEKLIIMGAGGRFFDGGWDNYQLMSPHNVWKDDRNILYRVEKGGNEFFSNSDALYPNVGPGILPQGYSFLLQFDGEKVRIWQDQKELEIYGSGYYHYDRTGDDYQWYVPGYKNFTVDELGSKVKVTMAVINTPQVFVKGNYGKTGTETYNELYYLKQNLETERQDVIDHAIRMGAGLALFVVYLILRKDKARADRFLARGTGKVWFEVKLVLAVLLLAALLPRGEEFTHVWQEVYWSYNSQNPIASTAIEAVEGEWRYIDGVYHYVSGIPSVAQGQTTVVSNVAAAVGAFSENAGWLLRCWVQDLCSHPGVLLLGVWGLYLLLVNDWRYNKKPWRHGVVGALLCAGELKYPFQRRLRRSTQLLEIALILLAGLAAFLFLTVFAVLSLPLWSLIVVGIPYTLTVFLAAAVLERQRRLWIDFGAVADQASAIRSGNLEAEAGLPEGSDLGQLADDLNHIRQGLHRAVEERTQSERLKVELVTNVSHDIKTPLTSIISYAELLEQEQLEPPAGEYVRILSEKAQRLKTMVQDVFEVSKAASGQLPVKLERLDYARLLRQTLADMDAAISESGLTLRPSIPDGEVPIVADSDRMYRVFQNLIGNALKYALPGSRVFLSLQVKEGAATASVKNISAAELKPGADYTGRFVRGDESRSDGGSGLGLSIADSFTRACGGELTVTTEADLFTAAVSFPLAAAEQTGA